MAPLIPTIAAHARSIMSTAVTARSQAAQTASEHLNQLGPLAARAILLGRDDKDADNTDKNGDPITLDPSRGVTNPKDINNTFIFILFGLIGVAFVVTGIWFFFWAKNGGFYFKEDDWDDYKSTVLRRKGPNGTILSNATKSTNLGGGSIYKDVDDGRTEYTGGLTQMTGETGDTVSTLSGITAGPSDIGGRERRRREREKKEREHEKRRDRKRRSSRRKVGEDGVLVDEDAEADAKRNLRAYRSERPARVGGLNREADGSEWDGSTNPEISTISGSEMLLNNRQNTPTSSPTKEKEKEREKRSSSKRRSSTRDNHHHHRHNSSYDTATEMTYDTQANESQASSSQPPPSKSSGRKAGGIRKVYSTADRTSTRENERLRAEARRLAAAEKGRVSTGGGGSGASGVSSSASVRRDFAYQRADLRSTGNAIPEEHETGSLMGGAEHEQDDGHDYGQGRYLPPPYAPTELTTSTAWGAGGGGGGGAGPVESSDIGDGGDRGTKSYRHYIPGLSSSVAGPSAADAGGASTVDGSAVGSGSGYTSADDRRERRKRRDAQRSRRE